LSIWASTSAFDSSSSASSAISQSNCASSIFWTALRTGSVCALIALSSATTALALSGWSQNVGEPICDSSSASRASF